MIAVKNKTKARKGQNLIRSAKLLCYDLKRILNDFDENNEEEHYEIELSLHSYFKDNKRHLQKLADELLAVKPWYYSKDEILPKIGFMIKWLQEEFYNEDEEEDERIRVWSKNINIFNSKYDTLFNSPKSLIRQLR